MFAASYAMMFTVSTFCAMLGQSWSPSLSEGKVLPLLLYAGRWPTHLRT